MLISILVAIVVLVLILYMINMVPDVTLRRILHGAVVVLFVIWLLSGFGLLGPLPHWR